MDNAEELEKLKQAEDEAWKDWDESKKVNKDGDLAFMNKIMWIVNKRAQILGLVASKES